MAKDQVKVELTLEDRKFLKSLKRATERIDNFGDEAEESIRKAGLAFSSFAGNLASTAVANAFSTFKDAAIGAFKSVVNEAAKIETLEVKFKTLTGSIGASKRILQDLQEFAAKTPFQLPGIAEAASKLLAFGVESGNVVNKLEFLGDIAAASGADLGELTLIFGQVAAAGKLTGERLLQLQERAIPIGPALAKTMGVAESSIRDLVSKGKVDFATFEKAFQSLNKEGQFAFEGMIAQSKTFSGVMSTLNDNVTMVLADIGKELLPIIKAVSSNLLKLLQNNRTAIIDFVKRGVKFLTDNLEGAIKVGGNFIRFLKILRTGFETALIPVRTFGSVIGEIFKSALTGDFSGIQKRIGDIFKKGFDEAKKNIVEIPDIFKQTEIEKQGKLFARRIKKSIEEENKKAPINIQLKPKIKPRDREKAEREDREATVKQGVGLIESGLGVGQNVLRGAAGAQELFKAGITAGALAAGLPPQLSGPVAEVALLLSKGADQVRQMVKEFASTFVDMIDGLMEATTELPIILIEELIPKIPDIAQKLGEQMPNVAASLATAMPAVGIALAAQAPFIAVSFIDGLIDGVPRVIQTMIDNIKSAFSGGVLGGGSGSSSKAKRIGVGIATGGLSEVFRFAKKKFGFQDGGIVPDLSGIPSIGDNVVAGLNPGEMVLTKEMQSNLFDMITTPGRGGGVVINVAGNVIADDDAQVDSLVRRISDAIELRNVTLRGV